MGIVFRQQFIVHWYHFRNIAIFPESLSTLILCRLQSSCDFAKLLPFLLKNLAYRIIFKDQ